MHYMVQRITHINGEHYGKPYVLFEGTLEELDIAHPRSKMTAADTLGREELEEGSIVITTSFLSRTSGSEQWIPCEDPRKFSVVPTVLERLIQAENARLYPEPEVDEDEQEEFSAAYFADLDNEEESRARQDARALARRA